MYYYVYKIENKINGNIYVGCHRTKKLDDGYMGSGNLIIASIKKNGIENFEKTILEFFENADDMYEYEKSIVNEEFVRRTDTYNLREGGWGGRGTPEMYSRVSDKLKGIKKSDSTKSKMSASQLGTKKSEETKRKIAESASRRIISDETRKKQSESARLSDNKSKGTVWVNDGAVNKRISKDLNIPHGFSLGRI